MKIAFPIVAILSLLGCSSSNGLLMENIAMKETKSIATGKSVQVYTVKDTLRTDYHLSWQRWVLHDVNRTENFVEFREVKTWTFKKYKIDEIKKISIRFEDYNSYKEHLVFLSSGMLLLGFFSFFSDADKSTSLYFSTAGIIGWSWLYSTRSWSDDVEYRIISLEEF